MQQIYINTSLKKRNKTQTVSNLDKQKKPFWYIFQRNPWKYFGLIATNIWISNTNVSKIFVKISILYIFGNNARRSEDTHFLPKIKTYLYNFDITV